jgi:4'-phosphopantetheinyl transferase
MNPQYPALGSQDVHVHAVRVHMAEPETQKLLGLLSEDERARAERFHFARDRERFVVSHGVLRILLGRLLAQDPAGLRFSEGAKGKPALRDRASSLHFNMSHSGELAVYSFAHGCEVGIDVEEIRLIPDLVQVAARFFSPAENVELMGLTPDQRIPAFFRCWTRKEAYIKATGDGLSAPLDEFRVSLLPGEPARIMEIRGSAEEALGWCLQHLDWAEGYVSALAYAGSPRTLLIYPLEQASVFANAL